jgi:hypothetical protein
MSGCSDTGGLIALFFVVGMSQRMRLDHLCLESALSLELGSSQPQVSLYQLYCQLCPRKSADRNVPYNCSFQTELPPL